MNLLHYVSRSTLSLFPPNLIHRNQNQNYPSPPTPAGARRPAKSSFSKTPGFKEPKRGPFRDIIRKPYRFWMFLGLSLDQNPWIYQLLLCSNTGCWAHKTPSEPSALGYKNNLFLWRLGGSSHRSQGVFTTRAMASPGFTCAICKWTRIIIKIICICSS